MSNGSIKTQLDDLIASLKRAGGKLSVKKLSASCGMGERETLKWLHILEKSGSVHLENRFEGVSVTWISAVKSQPQAPGAVDVGAHRAGEHTSIYSSDSEFAYPGGYEYARDTQPVQQEEAKERHKVLLEQTDMELAKMGDQISRVEDMISKLKAKKASKHEEEKEEAPTAAQPSAEESDIKPINLFAAKHKRIMPTKKSLEKQPEPKQAKEKPVRVSAPGLEETPTPSREETPAPVVIPLGNEEKNPAQKFPLTIIPQPTEFSSSATRQIYPARQPYEKKRAKIEKIRRPAPVEVSGASLQFSEKLARQVHRILAQNQEMEKLRAEKQKLLAEHYMPMQRRLESEIETISDRILRMEKNIVGMQQRAADLPQKVSVAEKLQLSSIKAHGQMRRAYDEASALLEESGRELSEGREKLEILLDQSRQEIATHRSKTEELERTLTQITSMEEEASGRVLEARASLAEQAERLASAETHARDLMALKDEIKGSVNGIKREISTTKGILTGIEKQMEQMRQVEIYADSICQDYDRKMSELGDYIRGGNEEFETLRESVESNFVRRYLRELRQLSDGYSFEFGQLKGAEESVDVKLEREKRKIEELLEEAKKISHLYELQSREITGSENFEQRQEIFRELPQLSAQRSQIEQMVAQIVGNKTGGVSSKRLEITVSAPKVPRKSSSRAKAEKKAKRAKAKSAKKANGKANAKAAKKAAQGKSKKKGRR